MRRRRTLIAPPLTWEMNSKPVDPPMIPVLAERGGTQLKTPRPTLVVDTREQDPFEFTRFPGWFSAIERRPLKLGDYSVAGMEELCAVERKGLADLVHSFTANRKVFVERLRALSELPRKLLVVTASLGSVKSPFPHSAVDPNRVLQSLIAALAGLGVPFVCADTHELGEELAAAFLYQTFLYHWLEQNGYGSQLVDGDL